MTTIHHLWTAVWPNLAANVVWIPVVGAHHWWTRRRMTVLHDIIHELHALKRADSTRHGAAHDHDQLG